MNGPEASKGSRAPSITLWLIGVLAGAGMLPMLSKSLWIDEGASLYSARLSWSGLWRQSQVVDRVFLAYYAVLHLWVTFSLSIEWVRFLSVIAYALSVVVIGHIGNRCAGLRCGVIAAILTAANPLMIDAALDARPYAPAALAVTLAIYSLLRWRDSSKTLWFYLFCVFSLIALAFHVFAVLGPLAVLVTLFLMRTRRFQQQWRGIVPPLAATLLISVAYSFSVVGQRQQVGWIPRASLVDLYGPAEGYPRNGRLLFAALVLLPLAFALACILRQRGNRREPKDSVFRENLSIALAWAALPTVGLIAVSFVKPLYVDRYVTASAPGMALAVGLLLAKALTLNGANESTWKRRAEVAAWGVIVAGLAVNSAVIASTTYENYKGVATYLEHRVGPLDEIALPDHGVATSTEYYLRDRRDSPSTWPEVPSQPYILGLDLRESDEAFAAAANNVWVVEDETTGLRAFLDALSRHGYVNTGTDSFWDLRTVTVAHYERSSP
jgi:mannosyltransferase